MIHFDVQWCMMDAGRMAPYVGFTEAEVHDLFAERKKRECYGCITEKKVLQKQPIAPILDYGRKAIALKRKQQVWFFTRIMRII